MTRRLTLLLLGVVSATSWANLPASAVTKMAFQIYGIYTTNDPTCLTGLFATRPLSATSQEINFAAAPSLGTGPVPADGIKCLIIVAKAQYSVEWIAGSYAPGVKRFGSNSYQDSNCNAGGSTSYSDVTETPTCQPGIRPTNIDWPQKIKDDMAALGISYATECNGSNAGNIFPIYVSTYSKCTGETVSDNVAFGGIGGTCEWSLYTNVTPEGYRANTIDQAPTAADDHQHGIKLNVLSANINKYKLIIDPLVGGTDTGCGIDGPPKFSLDSAE